MTAMTTLQDMLAEAAAARAAEIEALAGLDDDQLDYLGNLDQVSDPATDGLECDADT